jgi:aminoglycoside phosphotransferase (APT) family kinase protein
MGLADPSPPELAEIAGQIVRAVAGVAPARVTAILRGVMTWKFDVALGSGERFIVRFYPPGREAVVDYEPDLLRRSAALGHPVPVVVTDARSGPSSRLAYVLYRRLEGSTLGDRWSQLDEAARQRAARHLSAALKRLHTVAIEGWGEPVTAWRARDTSWVGYVGRVIDEGMVVARKMRALPPDLLETVRSIRAGLGSIPPPERPGLVWADVSPDNVLIDPDGGLVGLLDFESCLVGELCANLGYCFAGQVGTGFYEALRAAWMEELTEAEAARIDLYPVVRAMRIAKFAHGPLPTGLPRRSLEDLLPGLRPAAESWRRRLEQRR